MILLIQYKLYFDEHYFFVVQHNNEIYENWYFVNIDETTVTINQLSFYATTF